MNISSLIALLLAFAKDDSRYDCPPEDFAVYCRCTATSRQRELVITCAFRNSSEFYTMSNSRYAPYTVDLSINLNLIRKMPSLAFIGWGELRRLFIDGTNLYSVHSTAFRGIRGVLEVLHFRHTKLREVPVAAVRRLRKLATLIMEKCPQLSLNVSLKSTRLRHLSVVNNENKLTISEDAFPTTLETLVLDNNIIQSLNGSLRKLSKLKYLSFAHNRIGSLINEVVDSPHLETLLAGDNNFSSISDIPLIRTPYLQILNLSDNYISYIPQNLIILYQLTVLDLSHNFLTRLSAGAFKNFKSLQFLYLNNNKIMHVSNGLFDCLRGLTVLDLSHNLLTEMNFISLPNSVTRQAQGSRGSTRTCDFWSNTKLTILSIVGNKITCNDATRQTIKHLNAVSVSVEGNPC